MAVFPVLLDTRPQYLRAGEPPQSLLLTPLGRDLLISRLLAQLAAISPEPVRILAGFEFGAGYPTAVQAIAGENITVARADYFDDLVHELEPSDWLLLIDAAQHPVVRLDRLDTLRTPPQTAAAQHLVALKQHVCGAHECVHLDTTGSVRRIQRYYDGVTWYTGGSVACSLVSVAAARCIGGTLTSLTDLRQELARRGAPALDTRLEDTFMDLNDEAGLLACMERVVRAETSAPTAFARPTDDQVCVGPGCTVHPSARLLGHVILQAATFVAEGVHIVGPALLGARTRVGAGASLAHCLVLPGTTIAPHATLRGRVIGGMGFEQARPHRLRRVQPPMHAPLDGQAGGRAYSLYGAVKRCADFVIALIALLMLLPLFVGVAILIKVDSPGPVLFSQRREGRAGRVFRCWKFRTMVAHADAQQRALYVRSAVDGPQFKIEHDPRVTRVGHGLRKTNIDELPQLINVLLGQMSLIGPRPSPFRENQICVPWRQARLSVRPGITGLWQICRHERDAGDFHQWIYFDILYVRHLSWSLDLRIFVGTLLTCGGRWSVPLAKLIPGERLSGVDRAAALACAQAGYHRARVQTPAVPCAYPLGRPA